MSKVYGIDPGRSTFTVARMEGETMSFPNTEPGYRDCLSWIGQEPSVVVVEGRGNGVSRLCVKLVKEGHDVRDINPMTAGKLCKAMDEDKTDENDSVSLAEMASFMLDKMSPGP